MTTLRNIYNSDNMPKNIIEDKSLDLYVKQIYPFAIDTDNIINSNYNIENLICCICFNIFNNPIILDCSHTFCDYCITKHINNNSYQNNYNFQYHYASCPLCRSIINKKFKENKNFKFEIDKLIIKDCDNCHKCHSVGDSCIYECIYCLKLIDNEDKKKHLINKCLYKIIQQCEYCLYIFFRIDMKQHINYCKKNLFKKYFNKAVIYKGNNDDNNNDNINIKKINFDKYKYLFDENGLKIYFLQEKNKLLIRFYNTQDADKYLNHRLYEINYTLHNILKKLSNVLIDFNIINHPIICYCYICTLDNVIK